MSRSDRVDKLEESTSDQPCSVCGSKGIVEERYPGGEVRYPFGTPCTVCNSVRPGGGINHIIVDMTGDNERRDPDADDDED